MGELLSTERDAVERAAAEPMLDQVLAWSAVNSGSRNLGGLERMAELLADAFSALPGVLRLENPAPVESVDSAGKAIAIRHGRHLHLSVRPTAPVQLLFTGHMDTVFGADHADHADQSLHSLSQAVAEPELEAVREVQRP